MANSNIQTLQNAGLLADPTNLTPGQETIIEGFSKQEVDALISTSQKLGINTTMVQGITGTSCSGPVMQVF